jgi:hypothetical protein
LFVANLVNQEGYAGLRSFFRLPTVEDEGSQFPETITSILINSYLYPLSLINHSTSHPSQAKPSTVQTMKVLIILMLVLSALSASARSASVQRILEPMDGAILNENAVMHEDGVEPHGLSNGLKTSCEAEILNDYNVINGFAVRMDLDALQNPLKNIKGVKINPNDVASSSSVQSPVASWGLDRVDQQNLDKAYSYLRDGSNVDVYTLDTGIDIIIDLEDLGVPSTSRASFGSDFTGEENEDDYGNTTTRSTTDTSSVFKEPLVIQGAPDAQFGRSIALSGDGSILAVGAPFDNEFGSEAGRVSLYELVGNSATLLFDFSGAQDGLRVGQVLSMSRSSPPVLAIGGTNFVDVYTISQFLDGGGSAADPPLPEYDRFEADFTDEAYGASVTVSGDGTRLAVGAPGAFIGAHDVGQVQIYEIGAGQVGTEIVGLDGNDFFGSASALSEDGMIVAVGALTGSSGAGYVRVFNQNGANWDQVGRTIEGRCTGDNLGKSLSMSADGQTVAIGAHQADAASGAGYVQVYQLVGTVWTQIGADIVGPDDGDRFGFSVALTPDASFLTIGANANDSGGYANNGLVQTYENQNGNWTQIGGDIIGNADSRNLGVGVAISSDGQMIAAGGPLGTTVQDANIGEASVHSMIQNVCIRN